MPTEILTSKNLELQIKDLYVEYRTMEGTVYALNGMELLIEKGKTLGLVGETGAGKSTTGLAVLKLIPNPPGVITKGEIYLDGKPILVMSEKDMEKIRGKNVSMIFQDPMSSLNPIMPIIEQIAEVIRLHEKVVGNEAIKRAQNMLEIVGIPKERGVEFPHQFSGGMKQRVVIAIALACNPNLLIADEPTTALDVTIQAQVLEMMKELKEKNSTAMLMITHDLGIVAEMCDVVSVVYAGRVVEHGALKDIFENTRHPYTEGLFNSLPDMENKKDELKPIRGLMPDPTNIPSGCPFSPRCEYAVEICYKEKPVRLYRNKEHYCECHLYNPDSIKKGGMIKR